MWRDWQAARTYLEENPPPSWHPEPNSWWGRPTVWRYLDDVVAGETFDEQRACFAETCTQATAWLESARATQPPPKRGVLRSR
jgi:hypothetical protein